MVGIPLKRAPGPGGRSDQYLRPRGSHTGLRSALKLSSTDGRNTVYIRSDDSHHKPQGTGQQYGYVYDEDDITDLDLDILEVLPLPSWDKERALIICDALELQLPTLKFLKELVPTPAEG